MSVLDYDAQDVLTCDFCEKTKPALDLLNCSKCLCVICPRCEDEGFHWAFCTGEARANGATITITGEHHG